MTYGQPYVPGADENALRAPRPRAWMLGLASIFAWLIYLTWFLAPPLAVASLVRAIHEVRRARDTGSGRTGAGWGLVVACFAVAASGFGCYGLVTLTS